MQTFQPSADAVAARVKHYFVSSGVVTGLMPSIAANVLPASSAAALMASGREVGRGIWYAILLLSNGLRRYCFDMPRIPFWYIAVFSAILYAMELRHLRYFVAVAELGSVSRAAERLFIAQPPLSKQIKQLEDEVGVKLLVRYARGVRLTDAGSAFLLEARDLVARSERAKRQARHMDVASGGVVRIGFVPSAGHTALPRLLRRIRHSRPHAEIDVSELISPQQIQSLCTGEIDIGMARTPIHSGRVTVVAELDDPFCLAVPEGHALSGKGAIDLRRAANCTFIASSRHRAPAYFDQALGLCSDAGFSPELRYEASTLYGVLDLVGAGLGVAIVPASAVMIAPRGFALRRLQQATRGGSLACIQLRGDSNPIVASLGTLAAEVFADLKRDLNIALERLN